ncbi:hypothetical protein RQP46_007030 [Phenoliferia psychrophenolica]
MDALGLKRAAEPDDLHDALSESTSKRVKVSPDPSAGAGPAPWAPKVAPVGGNEDEEEPEVVTTSEDLIYDLHTILSRIPTQRRAFAAFLPLPGAPMPGLDVKGAGGIGLALSTRDAAALKASALDVLRNDPAKEDVLSTAATAWELPASTVAFSNAMWGSFIHETVRQTACALLSTNVATTDISFQKLVLHDPSMSPASLVSAEERSPNAYAHVAIALPTSWEGGKLTLSLGSETIEVDQSRDGPFSTSGVTWHCDSSHSISPITTGNRLSLLYSLTHTSSVDPVPTVLDTTSQEFSLAETLVDWLKALATHPDTIKLAAIFLAARSATSFATLSGGDLTKSGLIRRAAKAHGFRFFVARVTVIRSGPAENCECASEIEERNNEREERRENYGCGYGGGGYRGWGSRRRYDYEDEEEDDVSEDEDAEAECGCHRVITDPESAEDSAYFYSLSDEDGKNYDVMQFPLSMEELCPGPPFEQTPDSEQYDLDELTVEHTYSRSALVLWPAASHDTILLSCLGATSLSAQLEDSLALLASLAPPDQAPERQRAENIARALCKSATATVANASSWVRSLLEAALTLREETILSELVRMSKGRLTPTSISSSNIARALETFGESKVLPLIEEMLKPAAKAPGSILSDSPSLLPHAGKLYAAVLSTTDHIDASEADRIAPLVARLGTATFERDILPHIKRQKAKGFHIALAQAFLHDATTGTGEAAATSRRLATSLLTFAVESYEPTPPVVASYLNGYAAQPTSVGDAAELITRALDSDRTDLVKRILDKLLAPAMVPYIAQVVQPFLLVLKANLGKRTGRAYTLKDEPFKSFANGIISGQLDAFQATSAAIGVGPAVYQHPGGYKTPAAVPRSSSCWKLLDLILDSSDPSTLLDKLYTRLLAPPPHTAATYFSKDLPMLWVEIKAELTRRGLAAQLERPGAKSFNSRLRDVAFTSQFNTWSKQALGVNSVAPAIESLKLALTSKSATRLTQVTNLITNSAVAQPFCAKASVCFKLMPEMVTDAWAAPLRHLIAATVRKVVESVGVRPALADNLVLPKIGCNACNECALVDAFLVDPKTATLSLPRLQRIRDHVSIRIRQKGLSIGLIQETVKYGSPHTLRLTKPTSWQGASTWKTRQDAAVVFAKQIAEAKLLEPLGLTSLVAVRLGVK